jgi:glycosyltransferase involved in cell wall biosynthesis
VKIAFHVPRATYLGPWHSGDHVLVESLISGLRKRGHQVEIASRLSVRDVGRGRIPARRLVRETIAARRRMRRFSPDAWLVYGPSVTYPDLLGWWQRPRRYVLFAAHQGKPERLPRRLRRLFAFAHERSLQRADRIANLRPKRLFPGLEEKVQVLPPAVDLWDSIPSQEEARRGLALPQDATIVLCVSRLTEQKNAGRPGKTEMILDLLDAIASLPGDVLLLIVGEGAGRQRVESRVAERGLKKRVRLTGSVEDVKLFYAACDVFAYPYGLDRPWVSVLEAQACGRPVVTMRTHSAETTVLDGRTGVLAGDLNEFRDHLASLTSDRRRCESMGREARDYIARSHSIDVRTGQLEELLGARRGE